MFSVPMVIPVRRGIWRRSRGGAVCRRSEPWSIGQGKVSGILVGPDKKGRKRRIIPVLATIEYTAVLFP